MDLFFIGNSLLPRGHQDLRNANRRKEEAAREDEPVLEAPGDVCGGRDRGGRQGAQELLPQPGDPACEWQARGHLRGGVPGGVGGLHCRGGAARRLLGRAAEVKPRGSLTDECKSFSFIDR